MKKRRKQKSIITQTLIILGAITLAVMGWYSRPRPTPPNINVIQTGNFTTNLSLSPTTISTAPNTESSIDLNIDTTTSKITGAQIEITFDQSKIGTPTVTLGNFLPNTLAPVKIGNGVISFTLAASPSSGGKMGTGTLATIKIKPSILGTSTLGFSEMNAIFAIGSQDNVLKSTNETVVTIASPTERPAKPTGLRHNCFDGGNKITLRWDAVSGVDSYKLRLDQKDGSNDKSIDGIKVTEGETTILPDQKYSWWVHSTKDGIDSEEAKINEVVCAKTTSSPTPTPTPKPTVKPTVKPAVKPTSTPVVSVKPSSTPTTSIIPIPSPTSFGSLNDIFADKNAVTDTPKSSSKPSFFKQISLGWQAIFTQLALLFK